MYRGADLGADYIARLLMEIVVTNEKVDIVLNKKKKEGGCLKCEAPFEGW